MCWRVISMKRYVYLSCSQSEGQPVLTFSKTPNIPSNQPYNKNKKPFYKPRQFNKKPEPAHSGKNHLTYAEF